jgi:lipopolysaccharide export LptBFGC system permease protein LptF
MPRLISRYIAVEVLKTMMLSTTMLVAVIAFGAAIKPLAQNLIGGGDVFKYVLIASVPMLQYALPFAAGFAATIVLHRLANDNELLAMSVSGLSYGTIFRPVIGIGVGLLVFMLVLVNYLVPVFWTQMESLLARDVTRLLASSVDRGEAFQLGSTQIFADDVVAIDHPENSDAESRLVLIGVAALETDEQHEIKTEFTAEYATLDVHRINGRTILKLTLGESTIYREQDEALVRVPSAEPRAMDLGRGFTRKPKSFTIGELLAYRTLNTDYPSVAAARTETFNAMAMANAWACVEHAIETGESIMLHDSRRGVAYALRAGEVDDGELSQGVDVAEVDEGTTKRTAHAATATLHLVDVPPGGSARFDLLFEPSEVDDAAEPDAPIRHWPARLARLELASCTDTIDRSIPHEAFMEDVARYEGGTTPLWTTLHANIAGAAGKVASARESLRWDIDARMQQRLAQSMLAPLLLFLGAVLAISFRSATPLMIYTIAFLPSIAAILLISTGEQELRGGSSLAGEVVLWSGNGLLVVSIVAVWVRMRRN